MKIASRQIITTHINTDFDALASVIGATILYPEAVGVIPKMVNSSVRKFLATHKSAFDLYLPNEVDYTGVQKLIVVDTDQWQRLDRMKPLQKREDEISIEVWDHHTQNQTNIKADFVCKEDVGATVTLLVREMRRRNIKLSPLESTILLLGLYEDTGHLSFTSTTPEDARAAVYLLENDADLNVASFFLRPPYEESQKDILFEMLKTTEKEMIHGHSIGFNIVTLDKKITDLAHIVSSYRNIINVNAVFVIFVNDSHSTVIARSGIPAIDVGRVMRSLGGGGHSEAASATLRGDDCSGPILRAKIRKALLEERARSVKISDLMSFPVITVDPTTPMRNIQELMQKKNVRGVVVTEGDKIEGMVVLEDFKKIRKENQWLSPAKAFMSRDIITITPDTPPPSTIDIMDKNNIGHLPVVQDGKMIGIISRTDIITYVYGLVPE